MGAVFLREKAGRRRLSEQLEAALHAKDSKTSA
jgi:hypothetical protein